MLPQSHSLNSLQNSFTLLKNPSDCGLVWLPGFLKVIFTAVLASFIPNRNIHIF